VYSTYYCTGTKKMSERVAAVIYYDLNSKFITGLSKFFEMKLFFSGTNGMFLSVIQL
jgi:hypothetical protein